MSNDFVLPDGSCFDLEIGLGDDLPNSEFNSYGTLLEQTSKRLTKYGLKGRKVDALSTVSAECGDDEIQVNSHPVFGALCLVIFSEFLGMKLSEKDTSMNPRYGNFAEDLVMVPDGYEQTYRFARQTSDFRNMAFLDVPKIRLAIDIRPMRMNYSSTNDGKAGMLGSRLAWIPRNAPTRCMWEMFNLFQDLHLGLMRDDKFAYLPTAMGGYGKPIPFGHAPNFEAIISSYKQGTHAPLCRELIRRASRRFSEYTTQGGGNTDEVLNAVARLQSSWHDWIKGKSLYAPTCWLEAPAEVIPYRVVKHGNDVLRDAAARRLLSTGHLVTESDLAITYEHNLLCQFLLNAETHEEFMEKRAEARKQWLNLSTFSLRLIGLITPLRVDQNLQGILEPREYEEFWLATRKGLHLRSFLKQEYLYNRRARDILYQNGPMMTGFSLSPEVTHQRRRYWFEQTKDFGSEFTTDEETADEYQRLLDWLSVEDNPEPAPRRLVEDDPFILREIGRSPDHSGFAIVTDDIALCREAYFLTRRWVCRIPTDWYYMSLYFGDGDEPWLQSLRDKYPFCEWNTILDEGSISSHEEIAFRDGVPICYPVERRLDMTQVSFRKGKRIYARSTTPIEREDYEGRPPGFPQGFLFAPNHFLQRKKHPYRRGWA
jgi:hypothetical protein